jgi:hypothetical protein
VTRVVKSVEYLVTLLDKGMENWWVVCWVVQRVSKKVE